MQVASCDARPRTREESNPRPAGSGSRRANHETTPEDQFEQQKSQKTLSFCTSTTPIPAEGCASTAEIAKKTMGFCTSTTPIPAEGRASRLEIAKTMGFCTSTSRGSREQVRNRKKPWVFAPRPRRSREQVRNRKKPWVFAPRPRRSPQRVARAPQKSQKKPWVFAPRPRRSPQRVDFRVVSSALPRRPKKRF